MSYPQKQRTALLVALSAAMLTTPTWALDFDFYSSLRVAAESVDQDGPGSDDYSALRDAYSRIGFKADYQINDTVTGYAQFELPIDVPNKAIQDPFNQSEDIRIAKIGVKGNFGNLAVGQMWMPYYNAIAYPVDMFSSYYSGFATFTSFRLGDTVTYYTPSWKGFSAAAAFSDENGNPTSSGTPDDRIQGTVSYSNGGLTVSGGIDDFGGTNDTQLLGASLTWQATDALYVGAKYEEFNSDKNTGTYGDDGDSAANLYAGYTIGKNTLKAMIANVDNYGDDILHLGVDHQYSKDLKFFVEYYSEDEAAAITDKRAGGTCTSCTGGSVITAGLRWDFGASTNEQRQSSFAADSSPIDFAFYASLRVAAESVDQDGPGSDDYSALRDAYSRIGFKADYQINDTVTGYAQFELPIDVPNKAIQDPFNQSEDIRIAKIGVKGNFGNLAVGQMWMPYYNAIAYPVDMFSSYYSGFATFTSFRLGDTVTYYTPSWKGFSAAAAFSDENGNPTSSGTPDDRIQGTVSYSNGGLTVSGGIDDFGGTNDTQLLGASLTWQATDALYVGAKYEEFNSDKNTGTYGDDGDSAANLYAGYTIGKNTLKAMIANVDNYGDDILHLGVDHQYSKDLKFFVEYYSEDEAAAITDKRAGGTCTSCTGGSVITAGLRWDFGAP